MHVRGECDALAGLHDLGFLAPRSLGNNTSWIRLHFHRYGVRYIQTRLADKVSVKSSGNL